MKVAKGVLGLPHAATGSCQEAEVTAAGACDPQPASDAETSAVTAVTVVQRNRTIQPPLKPLDSTLRQANQVVNSRSVAGVSHTKSSVIKVGAAGERGRRGR